MSQIQKQKQKTKKSSSKGRSKSKTNKQKLESLEFTESELATILFEHPILGSLADYPNGRLLG